MFHGLRTVIYYVEDLAKATAWWTGTLGQPPYFDEPFYVGFNVGGYELGLHPEGGDTGTAVGQVTYWGVTDIVDAYRRLLERGATEHTAVQDVGGGIKVASVMDPSGNVVGIIENPHFRLPGSLDLDSPGLARPTTGDAGTTF